VSTDHAITRVAKNGGAPDTFAQVAFSDAASVVLAADESGVYWVDGSVLYTANAPGQTPVALDMDVGFVLGPLLLDAHFVYWMSLIDDGPPGSTNGSVWRVAKAGGAPVSLSPLSAQQIFFPGTPIATSLGRVAFADLTSIRVVDADGGAGVLAEQSPGVSQLSGDDSAVYWTAGPPSLFTGICLAPCPAPADAGVVAPVPDGIFAVGWDGGAKRTVSNSAAGLRGLQVFANGIWGLALGQTGPMSLQRVDLGTGEHVLIAGALDIEGFAVDATGVYWTVGSKLLMTPP
jgi:hypothetical protein